ncbi:MAG: endonuclease III [Clostridia bacterium]
MTKINQVISYLNNLYPDPKCALDFSSSYELLVAVILSAQCTDKRVNIVTKELFKVANTPESMLNLGEDRLKEYIRSCGFYNSKSKAIISASQDIILHHNGQVPSDLTSLTALRGVGRKTANVVISVAFGGQTIAVDTHVHRISKRLGLTTKSSTPNKCELDLMKLVPHDLGSKFHHQMIWFGRNICNARQPKCEQCELKKICKYYKEKG